MEIQKLLDELLKDGHKKKIDITLRNMDIDMLIEELFQATQPDTHTLVLREIEDQIKQLKGALPRKLTPHTLNSASILLREITALEERKGIYQDFFENAKARQKNRAILLKIFKKQREVSKKCQILKTEKEMSK